MENIHRRAIQSNFVSLVEQTDLDLMVSVLYEKGVFSEQMIEKYKDTTIHQRARKRQLYMDIMLRGPHAFGHLTDALQEAGYWNLARELDPNSSLHTRRSQPLPHSSGENSYISLSNRKKDRNRTDLETQKSAVLDEAKPQQIIKPAPYEGEPNDYIPHFDVKKSTKFYDEVDAKGIKPYRMRGKRGERGALVVFSYIEFQHGIEELRNGADVDAEKLKYLFAELGFKVCSYLNLTRDKTEEYLKLMNRVLAGVECAFIVVSSHGYQRGTAVDVDFRCSDGRLMSVLEFLEHFSNEQLPALVGVPKVFIFQLCRGPQQLPLPHALGGGGGGGGGEGPSLSDGTASAPPQAAGPLPPAPPPALAPPKNLRQYSDILIAHSTLPGYVSRRDPEHGSWYIQALCEVFAAHAHDCHVDKLLKLVDVRLEERFRVQTSTVEGWGFNRRLYLHPGLYETEPCAQDAGSMSLQDGLFDT